MTIYDGLSGSATLTFHASHADTIRDILTRDLRAYRQLYRTYADGKIGVRYRLSSTTLRLFHPRHFHTGIASALLYEISAATGITDTAVQVTLRDHTIPDAAPYTYAITL